MQPRSAGLLWDVLTATRQVQQFVAGKTWLDYSSDVLLRSGVERQFEIAGEAMNVLRTVDPETASRVPDVHRIVGMRNVLIHAYAEVNDLTVWQTANSDLDALIRAIEELLAEAGPPSEDS